MNLFFLCTESVPVSNMGYANFCFWYVYILMFIYLPVYLALDDGSTAPVPAAPPPPPPITDSDLDWHFTIAHACMATALDMFNVPVDSGATQKQAAT